MGGPPGGLGGVVVLPVVLGRFGSPSRRARSDREALSEGREGTGGPLEGPGGVGMSSWRVGRSQDAHPKFWGVWKPSQKGWEGRKALPESREWLGGLGEVRSPSKRAGMVRRPTKRGGGGERGPRGGGGGGGGAILESQEGLGGQGKVGCVSRRAERGQEALQKGTGGVGRPFQKAERGREALPEGLKESGVPPGGLVGVRRHSRRAWRGREALLESREGSGEIRSHCRKAGRIGRPYRWARRCCEALPEGQVVSEGPPGG